MTQLTHGVPLDDVAAVPAAAPRAQARRTDVLSVSDLAVSFHTRRVEVTALHGVSFQVQPGETLGLVGESGSGKSVACLTMMGLLDRNARIIRGEVRLGERCLLTAGSRSALAGELAMIFQYPRTALNPIRSVGDQLIDVLKTLGPAPAAQLQRRAVELLAEVRIAQPRERLRAYPFELSGGQCQRVLIAMALARKPKVLFADEPTTGLDVVTQRAIMELIAQARHMHGMSTILVTHDLALACEFCDRIVVMKQGTVVEQAGCAELFANPRHPYTRALLAATPAVSPSLEALRAALEHAGHDAD